MLEQLPEEILDRILSLALTPYVSSTSTSPPALSPRLAWHTRPSPHLAIFLTSPLFLRIATQHVYKIVHLATRSQARLLHRTLVHNPSLASHIRSLTMLGVWLEGGLIMAICKGAVKYLDINLERFSETGPIDREYGEGLRALVGVRHLIVRKPYNVYQSLPRLRYIVIYLAKAIEGWTELETAHIAFKLSDDTPTSPVLSSTPVFSSFSLAYPPTATSYFPASPAPPKHSTLGPITQLSNALARAPNLHTFIAQLPSVWNAAILNISTNPCLERIILSDGSFESAFPDDPFQVHMSSLHTSPLPWRTTPLISSTANGGISGSGLFLMEARKHSRLSQLIREGTSTPKGRVHTYATGRCSGSSNRSANDGDANVGGGCASTSVDGSTNIGLGFNWD